MKTIDKNELAAAQGGWYGYRGGNPYWALASAVRAETRAAYWNNQMWPLMAAAFANRPQAATTVIYT